MKSKVAKSVSMDLELLQALDSGVEEGESFSAYVCDLIRAGLEARGAGSQTRRSRRSASARTPLPAGEESTSDDSDGVSRGGQEQGGRGDPRRSQEQGRVRPQTASARPESRSESSEEGGDDSRRSFPDLDPRLSVEERVYSCVSDERRSLSDVARHVGVPEVEVGDVIEGLIQAGEPIILRREHGEWFCWLRRQTQEGR